MYYEITYVKKNDEKFNLVVSEKALGESIVNLIYSGYGIIGVTKV